MIEKGKYGVVRIKPRFPDDIYNNNNHIGFYFRDYASYGGWHKLETIWFKPFKNHLQFNGDVLPIHCGKTGQISNVYEFVRPYNDDERLFVSELTIYIPNILFSTEYKTSFKTYMEAKNFKLHVGKCRITFPKNYVKNLG